MYNNKYSDQLLPLITPEMLSRYPDQTCEILNKLIRLAQQSSGATVVEGGTGNLEDIIQTTTSYDDGGVNVVTAYLSDGTTQDFQIRNGHKGSQGEDGESATIAVGTTSTLPAGSSATVVNSGTSSAAVFDFGIPKGDTGAAGQDGADGFSPIATVTKSGDTATITITDENGTTTASVSDGSDGTAATIAAGTTTTLPAGSSATVTNSGTSSAAVFDFGIPKGDTGAAGQDGADGFSPIATVSKVGDTATITITDENGTTTASVTDGSDGAPGAAATISAGNTTTLPAGSSATVTNSGTSSAAVFDFGIPKGDTGAAGPANTLSIGTVQSGATADATITGTSPNQTLNLTLPQGSPGAAATVAAGTTTTLPAGSSATVTNTGTSSAAVFNFGIPTGADGAGVASGGTTGQVLVKNSNTDYDTSWSTMTIPTVNNATLTIQKNGTNVQTFTANQATNATANITVPTAFSDLTGTVGTSQIANDAVTSVKIDHSSINVEELVYTKTFTSDQTSDQNVIIPMNFTTYKKITIEASYEPLDTATGWRTSYARDNSNNRAICVQTGTEFNPSSTFIYRTQDQIVSHGVYSYCAVYIKIEILCTTSGNYPTFEAKGMGGWEQTGTVYAQNFLGRISQQGSNIKDIVLEMAKPRSGGWVRVTGVKR